MDYINKNYRYKIRKYFGTIIKNNKCILFLYNNFYKFINYKRYIIKITERYKLPISEYIKLSETLPYVPFEQIKDSNYYGHSFNIKKFAGLKHLNWSIEHGLMFGDYIPYSYMCKTTKRIMTMNDNRKMIIEKLSHKPTIAIGPYIHYADPLLTKEEFSYMKLKLGKILLFFPSHSSVEGEALNDIDNQIRIIDTIKEGRYDNVLVCMYYLDINNHKNYCEKYEKAGYKIVTAGHQLDLFFINRLKSIISLADYTVSSSVGTHIGYCVYLKKPHWIINDSNIDRMPEDYKNIYKTFRNYSNTITDEQEMVASKYWGFNNIKNNNDMHDILFSY